MTYNGFSGTLSLYTTLHTLATVQKVKSSASEAVVAAGTVFHIVMCKTLLSN